MVYIHLVEVDEYAVPALVFPNLRLGVCNALTWYIEWCFIITFFVKAFARKFNYNLECKLSDFPHSPFSRTITNCRVRGRVRRLCENRTGVYYYNVQNMKFALDPLAKRKCSHTNLKSKTNSTYNFWSQFANFNLTIEFAHVEPIHLHTYTPATWNMLH